MSLVNVKITREIDEHHVPCQNHTLFQTKKVKTIPYFRLKQLENHTLKYGTYPYSLCIGVTPRYISGSDWHTYVHACICKRYEWSIYCKQYERSNKQLIKPARQARHILLLIILYFAIPITWILC